jgi:hypothetical protein
MKKGLLFCLFLVWACCSGSWGWAAATLSQLYETPKDQVTTATQPEYNNLQSYVYDGIPGVTTAANHGAELILAMGEGGLVTFDYDAINNNYGIILLKMCQWYKAKSVLQMKL